MTTDRRPKVDEIWWRSGNPFAPPVQVQAVVHYIQDEHPTVYYASYPVSDAVYSRKLLLPDFPFLL